MGIWFPPTWFIHKWVIAEYVNVHAHTVFVERFPIRTKGHTRWESWPFLANDCGKPSKGQRSLAFVNVPNFFPSILSYPRPTCLACSASEKCLNAVYFSPGNFIIGQIDQLHLLMPSSDSRTRDTWGIFSRRSPLRRPTVNSFNTDFASVQEPICCLFW